MRVKEIISNQSVTINTGNFENQKINYGEVWEVEHGDNIEALQKELCNHVFEVVNKMANHVRKKNNIKTIAFKKKENKIDYSETERENRRIIANQNGE